MKLLIPGMSGKAPSFFGWSPFGQGGFGEGIDEFGEGFSFGQPYHSGGSVQGAGIGGNVPATLHRGEYVMQNSAVDSIGVENLNRMNMSGQGYGGANITFTGNVLSKDFIEDEAVPMIKAALRKGGNIGIG